MSRGISISYMNPAGNWVDVYVRSPYEFLGAQRTSKMFWGLPVLREIGIERLTELGVGDPVSFLGWEDMELLRFELELLSKHMEDIAFYPEEKSAYLAHLTYCYHLLVASAPRDTTPEMLIG